MTNTYPEIVTQWVSEKKSIYVYTVTKRLAGQITCLDKDYLVLDGRTVVNVANIVSISDVEQFEKQKPNNY